MRAEGLNPLGTRAGGTEHTMILHWLAGYSLWCLTAVLSGAVLCICGGVNLLSRPGDKNWVPIPVVLTGFLYGIYFAVSALLRETPGWGRFGHALGVVGAVLSIIWAILLMKHHNRKRMALPPHPQSAATSDDVWPPPPTSQGGGQP